MGEIDRHEAFAMDAEGYAVPVDSEHCDNWMYLPVNKDDVQAIIRACNSAALEMGNFERSYSGPAVTKWAEGEKVRFTELADRLESFLKDI